MRHDGDRELPQLAVFDGRGETLSMLQAEWLEPHVRSLEH